MHQIRKKYKSNHRSTLLYFILLTHSHGNFFETFSNLQILLLQNCDPCGPYMVHSKHVITTLFTRPLVATAPIWWTAVDQEWTTGSVNEGHKVSQSVRAIFGHLLKHLPDMLLQWFSCKLIKRNWKNSEEFALCISKIQIYFTLTSLLYSYYSIRFRRRAHELLIQSSEISNRSLDRDGFYSTVIATNWIVI